jgi:hypothetical protein
MEARDMLAENGARTAADNSYTRQLVERWGPLLNGIRDSHNRRATAMLLENQKQHLGSMNEETLSGSVGSFAKYVFPILRRVFPNLIANEIMSVQPMSSPVGAVFFYDYVYSNAKGGVASGDKMIDTFSSMYSAEYVAEEAVGSGNGTKVTFTGTLAWTPVRPLDADYGWSVTITDGVETFTDNGTGTLTGSASGTGTINYTTGEYNITFSVAPLNAASITANYYYNSENNSQIPEAELTLTMSEVHAKTRKLKAQWSVEAADDLRAFHGIDAEAELVAGLANEIALEVDREMIDMLIANAQTTTSWAYTATSGSRWGGEMDSIRNLLTTVGALGAKIHRKTKRAPANFIVTTPAVVNMLEQLTTHGDYRPAFQGNNAFGPLDPQSPSSYGPLTSRFGVMRVGTLMNKYAVYQDPFLSADSSTQKALIGLKGQNYMDAGAVYAPYVPIQVTPTFMDPANFQSRKGLRTRYAAKVLRPEYYAVVNITGLPGL